MEPKIQEHGRHSLTVSMTAQEVPRSLLVSDEWPAVVSISDWSEELQHIVDSCQHGDELVSLVKCFQDNALGSILMMFRAKPDLTRGFHLWSATSLLAALLRPNGELRPSLDALLASRGVDRSGVDGAITAMTAAGETGLGIRDPDAAPVDLAVALAFYASDQRHRIVLRAMHETTSKAAAGTTANAQLGALGLQPVDISEAGGRWLVDNLPAWYPLRIRALVRPLISDDLCAVARRLNLIHPAAGAPDALLTEYDYLAAACGLVGVGSHRVFVARFLVGLLGLGDLVLPLRPYKTLSKDQRVLDRYKPVMQRDIPFLMEQVAVRELLAEFISTVKAFVKSEKARPEAQGYGVARQHYKLLDHIVHTGATLGARLADIRRIWQGAQPTSMLLAKGARIGFSSNAASTDIVGKVRFANWFLPGLMSVKGSMTFDVALSQKHGPRNLYEVEEILSRHPQLRMIEPADARNLFWHVRHVGATAGSDAHYHFFGPRPVENARASKSFTQLTPVVERGYYPHEVATALSSAVDVFYDISPILDEMISRPVMLNTGYRARHVNSAVSAEDPLFIFACLPDNVAFTTDGSRFLAHIRDQGLRNYYGGDPVSEEVVAATPACLIFDDTFAVSLANAPATDPNIDAFRALWRDGELTMITGTMEHAFLGAIGLRDLPQGGTFVPTAGSVLLDRLPSNEFKPRRRQFGTYALPGVDNHFGAALTQFDTYHHAGYPLYVSADHRVTGNSMGWELTMRDPAGEQHLTENAVRVVFNIPVGTIAPQHVVTHPSALAWEHYYTQLQMALDSTDFIVTNGSALVDSADEAIRAAEEAYAVFTRQAARRFAVSWFVDLLATESMQQIMREGRVIEGVTHKPGSFVVVPAPHDAMQAGILALALADIIPEIAAIMNVSMDRITTVLANAVSSPDLPTEVFTRFKGNDR